MKIEITKSCEDSGKAYMTFPDGLRLVFENGEYVGWYVCGEEDRANPDAPNADTSELSFLDKIRTASDEELVQMFLNTELSDRIPFCKNLATCDPDVEGSITDEKCAVCLLEYLQRPAREFGMFKEE